MRTSVMPAPRNSASAALAPVNPRAERTLEYLLKALFTRTLAQMESASPGRTKRKYIGSKNHRRHSPKKTELTRHSILTCRTSPIALSGTALPAHLHTRLRSAPYTAPEPSIRMGPSGASVTAAVAFFVEPAVNARGFGGRVAKTLFPVCLRYRRAAAPTTSTMVSASARWESIHGLVLGTKHLWQPLDPVPDAGQFDQARMPAIMASAHPLSGFVCLLMPTR